MHKIFLILIILLFNYEINAQEPNWLFDLKQVRSLESTETDVEKIFGKPIERSGNVYRYKNNKGVLRVSYSEGRCNEIDNYIGGNYDVEKGTVVYVDFYLEELVKFERLKINTDNFEKEESSDTPNSIYKDRIFGISYGIYTENWKGPEQLSDISLFPSDKFSHLECSEKL